MEKEYPDNANFICIKGARLQGRDENFNPIERYFSEGDKVYLNFSFELYASPTELKPRFKYNRANGRYVFCNKDIRGDYIYLTVDDIKFFREIKHKHLVVKTFENEDRLNEWLTNIPIDYVKNIQMFDTRYLVTYINREDDEDDEDEKE